MTGGDGPWLELKISKMGKSLCGAQKPAVTHRVPHPGFPLAAHRGPLHLDLSSSTQSLILNLSTTYTSLSHTFPVILVDSSIAMGSTALPYMATQPKLIFFTELFNPESGIECSY
jgi:hypothetical protein